VRPPFVPLSWTVNPEEGSFLGIDPCGCACDFGRIAYERDCEFFTGGGPTTKILWYRAPPGAIWLPFPSAFMSLNWVSDPWECEGPGEIWTGPPKWVSGRTPPTAKGLAPFGPPAYFYGGQPWMTSMPFILRDDFGLAVACTGKPPPHVDAVNATVGISTDAQP